MLAVQRELLARRVIARVTACGCLGPCFDGPNAVVYGDDPDHVGPDGVWYGDLNPADAPALADHLEHGTIYEAKRLDAPG